MAGRVLVTGGAGFIGSHTCLSLLDAGFEPVIYDNFCNASPLVVSRLAAIAGRDIVCVEGDLCDRQHLQQTLAEYAIDAVVHFAGLKAVGESVAQPLRYFRNNVIGSQILIEAMADVGVRRLVFSSSATVYGEPECNPIPESAPLRATNPYGATKLVVENTLRDLAAADPAWSIACLRYFNPVGAHASGLIGEDPSGRPNNLMPYITQVAIGRRQSLQVYGDDYPTADGTGVRDYIHVCDLAQGHVAALTYLAKQGGIRAINLGAGRGVSVLELVSAFEQASGKAIPYKIVPRRAGDIATSYADTSLAEQLLGWRAQRSIAQICEDAWRWQQQNPAGYQAD